MCPSLLLYFPQHSKGSGTHSRPLNRLEEVRCPFGYRNSAPSGSVASTLNHSTTHFTPKRDMEILNYTSSQQVTILLYCPMNQPSGENTTGLSGLADFTNARFKEKHTSVESLYTRQVCFSLGPPLRQNSETTCDRVLTFFRPRSVQSSS